MFSDAFWCMASRNKISVFYVKIICANFFLVQHIFKVSLQSHGTTSVMKTGKKSCLEIQEYLMHVIKIDGLTVHERYFTAVTNEAQFVLQMHLIDLQCSPATFQS